MNQFNRTAYDARSLDMSVDAGLRSFMLGVYNKMGLGLLVTAAVAYLVGTVAPVTALVYNTPLLFVVQFGPIALLFGSMFFMRNPSPTGASLLYWAVVVLIGAGLSVWVVIAQSQTGAQITGATVSVTFSTIAQAFVITSAAFFGLSLLGYTTKMNLQPLQTFLFMGIIGVIAIGLINTFFVQSTGLMWIIQFAILGLMAGVVAWQTQNLKIMYHEIAGDERSLAVATTFGALNLYIAFINMFQVILMLLGNRE
jgi:FtsH-binding integral membrane protein